MNQEYNLQQFSSAVNNLKFLIKILLHNACVLSILIIEKIQILSV